jgi:hypothetical protein
MREQLNNNPALQLGVVAVLLIAGAVFFISMMGGGGESESAGGEAGVEAPATEATLGAPAEGAEAAASPLEAVPPPTVQPPAEVTDAWKSGATVALLFVRDGGIDDKLVREATEQLSGYSGVTTIVVQADDLARYSAITAGIGLERVPALVVMTPKHIAGNVPTASVHYGFQSPQAIAQAVIDAGYKGPTLEYHP